MHAMHSATARDESAADVVPEEIAAAAPPKKVLIFGFSITEEGAGYVRNLRQRLSDGNVVIDSRAIGGINIGSVPHLQSLLEYERYDHVLFEVTTCRRYSEGDPRAYSDTLARLVKQVRDCGSEPAFIHLYRVGIDYRQDKLLDACAEVCERLDVPAINLVPQLVEFERAGLLHDYLRDGIHTTPGGADYYASAIRPFLDKIMDDGRPPRDPGPKNLAADCAVVPVDKLVAADELQTFMRGNIVMPVLEITEGETRGFHLPEGLALEGVLYVRSPRSGIVEMGLGQHGSYKLHAFDQHSYYRRYSTWMAPINEARSFEITQLSIEPDVKLVKGERDAGPKVAEICGFLVRSV